MRCFFHAKGGIFITITDIYDNEIPQTETEMTPDEVSGEDPGAFSPQESPLSQTSSEMGVNNPLSAAVQVALYQTGLKLKLYSAAGPPSGWFRSRSGAKRLQHPE